MRSSRLTLFLLAFLSVAASSSPTVAEKLEELYFSGRLIEVNPAKHTFAIRNRNKELVFAVDVARCDITVDGSITERSLRFAHIGDAVLGKLSLKEARPFVTWVEFTRHPQAGKPVTGKSGYIVSPYLPPWPQPGYRAEPLDARQLKSGDMVMDDGTGKIFLVP